MMRRIPILFLGVILASEGGAQGTDAFTACRQSLRGEVIEAGVNRNVASRAFDQIEPNEQAVRFSKAQPELNTPIWDYFSFLVDAERISDGVRMMQEHEAELEAAAQRFGVDRHVLAALWGVESDYGQRTGDFFVPEALANMTCRGGPRADFWRRELIAALKLVEGGDLEMTQLQGSWAGAIGQTQFLPTTYEALAVDLDGDQRRDLVGSTADALGSAAHYLQQAGWRANEPWMIEVQVAPGFSGRTGREHQTSLSTWSSQGVTRADGAELQGSTQASLLLPAGPKGPGFLVFRNFDAIYAYNQAEASALAIAHLADRLAGYPALRTSWPTDDPGLSRAERRHLQGLLLARGYDVGEVDGKIGPITRAAIAEAEKDLGMAQTGRAGQKIYRALGGHGTEPEPTVRVPDWDYYDELFFGQ